MEEEEDRRGVILFSLSFLHNNRDVELLVFNGRTIVKDARMYASPLFLALSLVHMMVVASSHIHKLCEKPNSVLLLVMNYYLDDINVFIRWLFTGLSCLHLHIFFRSYSLSRNSNIPTKIYLQN